MRDLNQESIHIKERNKVDVINKLIIEERVLLIMYGHPYGWIADVEWNIEAWWRTMLRIFQVIPDVEIVGMKDAEEMGMLMEELHTDLQTRYAFSTFS